ncbi:MAG TPA: transcription elongation factor GreA [Gammaproteobacteria bacterium]|jgi:transcription elongation factor GreA|nr:transcription elongation factor GreA [Gammaproteobacteria bacterium]
MDRFLLTVTGAERLHAELKNLKSVQRPKVIAAIAEARSHGDLSENAEYDAAKEQQAFIEGRIAELNSQLSIAEVIDPTKLNANGKVVFGAYVTLFDEQKEKEVTYQLVGNLEADLAKSQISLSSPMGKALIAKQSGDEVIVKAPAGDQVYEVLSVRYQ